MVSRYATPEQSAIEKLRHDLNLETLETDENGNRYRALAHINRIMTVIKKESSSYVHLLEIEEELVNLSQNAYAWGFLDAKKWGGVWR